MLMFDSRKHALRFQAMVDLAAGEVLEDLDRERIAYSLRGHLKTEKGMMDELKQLKKKVKDSALRSSLEGILKDEEKHHQLLNRLVESYSLRRTTMDTWRGLWSFSHFPQAHLGE